VFWFALGEVKRELICTKQKLIPQKSPTVIWFTKLAFNYYADREAVIGH